MKAKLIKQNVENYQKTIKEFELAILELQGICPHETALLSNPPICADCKKILAQTHNAHLHYNEIKYRDLCTDCKNSSCNCTIGNQTVRQYFNHT